MNILTREELVDCVSQQLVVNPLTSQCAAILHASTQRVLDRIKQNIDAQIQEDLTSMIEEIVEELINSIYKNWVDNNNRFCVFPEGTRYVQQDGKYQFALVEQPPQIRHLVYKNSNDEDQIRLISVPYIQFIFKFDSDFLCDNWFITCTKKPMNDLMDVAYLLPLTNVNGIKVCTGEEEKIEFTSMNNYIHHVINSFWQSRFTSDYAVNLLNFIKNNKIVDIPDEIDQVGHYVASSYAAWEQKSKEDVFFAIGKKIEYKIHGNFRGLLISNADDKDTSANLIVSAKNKIKNSISEKIEDILTKIKIDFSTENREKIHKENLAEILRKMIIKSYSTLYDHMK